MLCAYLVCPVGLTRTNLTPSLTDPRLRSLGEAKVQNLKEWWDLKLESAIEAASKEDENGRPLRILGGMFPFMEQVYLVYYCTKFLNG